MWSETFGDVIVVWVIDVYHVSSRLAECANAVLEGSAAKKLFHRWKSMLYKGKARKVLKELIRRAEEFADRPGRAADLAEENPGRILWGHALYIERYCEHMRYDKYRAKGWPIASGHVEAFAKHIGGRMKAASKRWKPVVGSEAMVNLLAPGVSSPDQRRAPSAPGTRRAATAAGKTGGLTTRCPSKHWDVPDTHPHGPRASNLLDTGRVAAQDTCAGLRGSYLRSLARAAAPSGWDPETRGLHLHLNSPRTHPNLSSASSRPSTSRGQNLIP